MRVEITIYEDETKNFEEIGSAISQMFLDGWYPNSPPQTIGDTGIYVQFGPKCDVRGTLHIKTPNGFPPEHFAIGFSESDQW